MTTLDNDLEIASSPGASPIDEQTLYEQIAALVPRLPWAAPTTPLTSGGEASLVAGGPVLGDERGAGYAMVVRPAMACGPLARWVATRASELIELTDEHRLDDWWLQRRDPPGAVCVVGPGFTWREVIAVQKRGACVARLPQDLDTAAAWCDSALDRWRYPPTAPRRVWLVAPANDLFTRRLADRVAPAVCRVVSEHDIACDGAEDSTARVVVILAHGDRDGAPMVAGSTRDAILDACKGGAVVVHLGCHGAGRLAGDRYGALSPQFLGPEAVVAHDVLSPFARDCLHAGAPAVIAHLDATWSKTFERDSLATLARMVAWLAVGAVTAGYAAGMLGRVADARAREAVEHLRDGRLPEAGDAWLRHLDLAGFVCLGEVCARVAAD